MPPLSLIIMGILLSALALSLYLIIAPAVETESAVANNNVQPALYTNIPTSVPMPELNGSPTPEPTLPPNPPPPFTPTPDPTSTPIPEPTMPSYPPPPFTPTPDLTPDPTMPAMQAPLSR